MTDVVVVGGGVIGLSAAWLLADEGVDVTLVEALALGAGVSCRAHGQVVPPRAELRNLWTDTLRFYDRLAAQGDFQWDREPVGSTVVAATDAELPALAGREGELLDASAVRDREPGLAPCAGGLWTAEGRRLRPDLVVEVLARAARRAGVRVRTGARAVGLYRAAGGRWLVLTADGHRIAAPVAVLAAGQRTADLVEGITAVPPLDGVSGHILLTAPMPPVLNGIVSDAVLGPADDPFSTAVALMAHQRGDGRLVLGASWTRAGADPPRDLATRILRHAAARVPAVAGARIEASWSGVRPVLPDGLPVVDEVAPGLHICCGHGGEGFIAGPGSARAVARAVLADPPDTDLAPFRGDRFPHHSPREALT